MGAKYLFTDATNICTQKWQAVSSGGYGCNLLTA
jgi:hypothetical protein